MKYFVSRYVIFEFLILFGLVFFTAPVWAQQSAAGATLVGKVFCSDTGRPARFATVYLLPVDATSSQIYEATYLSKNLISAAVRNRDSAASAAPVPTAVSADGSYSLMDVPPGAYYVGVRMPGYLNPLDLYSDSDRRSADSEKRRLILASIPNITVLGHESMRLDLRVERAAAVSGRILYDDGAPAAGWQITARPAGDRGETGIKITNETTTDDRGAFRLTNFPAGSYILQAEFHSWFVNGNSATKRTEGFTMTVYSGGAFRAADAKPIDVATGEEHTGVDFTVPLHSLHSISGHVVAQSDGHPIEGGMIAISSPGDRDFHESLGVDNTGGFVFYYLPGNTTYKLRVDGYDVIPYAAGAAPEQTVNGMQVRPFAQHRPYAPIEMEIRVEDVDLNGLTISLLPAGGVK